MTGSIRRADIDEFRYVAIGGRLIGWIGKDLSQDLFADFIRDPDGFLDHRSAQVLKDSPKTKVVERTLADPRGAARRIIIKRFTYRSPLRRLAFLFFDSPAVRSLKGASLLKGRGFDTPTPLAAFELRNWNDLGASYYVAEAVENSCSVRSFWKVVGPTLAAAERIKIGRSIIRQLAEMFARLHGAGIYHGDLKGSNILMQGWRTEQRRFFLVDLDRVEVRRSLSLAGRLKNLLQVRVPWHPKERIYFYLRYAERCRASKKEAKALVRRALDLRGKLQRGAGQSSR